MNPIFLSKIRASKYSLFYLRWKALALAAIMIGSLTVWQMGLAQSMSQWGVVKHMSSSGKGTSSAALNPANTAKPTAPYDLSLINADSSYYQRIDAGRLYQMAPIPAGQKQHEELRIIGEPFRLALPQSWLEQPLVVQAKSGRPVTFVALDSGKFANDDISITVKADGRGLASTSFFVTNEGRYRVLAGSPENAGPATFEVQCISKTMRDEIRSGRYAERYFAEVRANKKRQTAATTELVERIRKRRAQ